MHSNSFTYKYESNDFPPTLSAFTGENIKSEICQDEPEAFPMFFILSRLKLQHLPRRKPPTSTLKQKVSVILFGEIWIGAGKFVRPPQHGGML